MPRLSQETLAIIGVGIALAALILTSTAGIRDEIQFVRDELRGEIQSVRDELRGEIQSVRDELRGEIQSVRDELRGEIRDVRVEARADRDGFQSHILRLTEQQGIPSARLDGVADQPATEQ